MKDEHIFLIGSPLLSVVLVVLLIIVVLIALTVSSQDLPGQPVPVQPAKKISPGTKHKSYSTNPPTSGWYSDTDLRDGVFTYSLSDEQIVSALVKGKVVISYNCQYKSESPSSPINSSAQLIDVSSPSAQSVPRRQTAEEVQAIWAQIRNQNKVCGDLTTGLRKIVEAKGIKNIIMAPRAKLDSRVALASWGRLDKFLWLDKDRINRFIDSYRGKKPKL